VDAPWQEGAIPPQIDHQLKEPGGLVEARTSGPAPSDLPERKGILDHVFMIQRERGEERAHMPIPNSHTWMTPSSSGNSSRRSGPWRTVSAAWLASRGSFGSVVPWYV
jgi:hypothetical protein